MMNRLVQPTSLLVGLLVARGLAAQTAADAGPPALPEEPREELPNPEGSAEESAPAPTEPGEVPPPEAPTSEAPPSPEPPTAAESGEAPRDKAPMATPEARPEPLGARPAAADPGSPPPSNAASPEGSVPATQSAEASAGSEGAIDGATTAGLGTVSEAELMAELEAIKGGEDNGVFLSGFMDVNYRRTLKRDPLLTRHDRSGSFFMGNANVYVRANMDRFRSLLEVRYTYLPNGVTDGEGDFTRTTTYDYTDHDNAVNLGGIEIERAHGEYEFMQELVLRAGQFLTPYGVWNVDHGSPTVIPIGIPVAIGQGLIPERQTGLDLWGRRDLGDATQIEYHLTLSNGRGPFESHLDLDKNKAVGGRLRLTTAGDLGDLGVGTSTYFGRYTDGGAADLETGDRPVSEQYDEFALAGDVKWTFEGILAQAEVVHQQVAYTERGRERLRPDRSNWGTYVLAGYRIPVVELMPFFKYERQDDQVSDLMSYAGGLNYRPLPYLVVKASVTHIVSEFDNSIDGEATRFDTQAAWAF